MNMFVSRAALAALLSLSMASFAGADTVRLPPSRGATPIEIPGKLMPRAVLPDTGRQSATPIEIPGKGKSQLAPGKAPGAVMALPIPIPGAGIERFDPKRDPGRFSSLPVPIPGPVRTGAQGKYAYAVLKDGTVYGDTTFGYSRFESMRVYQRFLKLHP